MKYLESSLKNLAILGLKSDQSLLNVKFVVASIFIVLNSALSLAFLIIEARTFLEYTNSIFMALTTTMIAVCFAILSYKVKITFVVLKFAEESIDKSEWTMFTEHLDVRYETNQININMYLYFIGIGRSRSASNIRRNQTICGESGQSFIHTFSAIDTDLLRISKGDILLLDLFHLEFGIRCIRFAICNVVSVQPICFENWKGPCRCPP